MHTSSSIIIYFTVLIMASYFSAIASRNLQQIIKRKQNTDKTYSWAELWFWLIEALGKLIGLVAIIAVAWHQEYSPFWVPLLFIGVNFGIYYFDVHLKFFYKENRHKHGFKDSLDTWMGIKEMLCRVREVCFVLIAYHIFLFLQQTYPNLVPWALD